MVIEPFSDADKVEDVDPFADAPRLEGNQRQAVLSQTDGLSSPDGGAIDARNT